MNVYAELIAWFGVLVVGYLVGCWLFGRMADRVRRIAGKG